jgi:hypothetical protein
MTTKTLSVSRAGQEPEPNRTMPRRIVEGLWRLASATRNLPRSRRRLSRRFCLDPWATLVPASHVKGRCTVLQ